MTNHFLDLKDMPSEILWHILDIAKVWKDARRGLPSGVLDEGAPLAGHTLAMIFEKSSTRTRISFEMAMRQLGGTSLVLQGNTMQLGRGETIEDTAKVISGYVDAVMVRADHHNTAVELASKGSVPVINALTDRSHPCQLMADMLTIKEHFGSIQGRKMAWMGDGNNVATSLMEAAVKYDFPLTLACPGEYSPNAEVLAWAREHGGDVSVTIDPFAATKGAHVVFTDTWISMGDDDKDARMDALAPFQVNDALMQFAEPNAIFLHCLPAHRGEEVTASVIDGPQSLVWAAAENRLHAQKAILGWCLGKI
ncbi:ornithine carbamoyltransferase [Kordiimonas aquimaris]|uniref:ornithine carbamoyltransferase n=1 Tax=Kordiimonas aquimaris TaxID=707591 RepID=UPI00374DA386